MSLAINTGNMFESASILDANLFAWDETYQFMSVTFDGGNYPAGYGGYMPMIAFQAIPVDGIFISTALTSPPGSAIDIGSSLGNGLYWCAGEIGFVKLATVGLGARCVMIGTLTAGQFLVFDIVMDLTGASKFHFHDPKSDRELPIHRHTFVCLILVRQASLSFFVWF